MPFGLDHLAVNRRLFGHVTTWKNRSPQRTPRTLRTDIQNPLCPCCPLWWPQPLREDRQRERRLHVEVAPGDFGQRSIEHRLRTLFKRGHKRQTILAELWQLQYAVDVDAELRIGSG